MFTTPISIRQHRMAVVRIVADAGEAGISFREIKEALVCELGKDQAASISLTSTLNALCDILAITAVVSNASVRFHSNSFTASWLNSST